MNLQTVTEKDGSPAQIEPPWLPFSSGGRHVRSVYLHVPFCAVKCNYCAFYSKEPDRETVEKYVEALCAEIGRAAGCAAPQTLFFGGGTPSLLSVKQLERVFKAVHEAGWGHSDEWTVECNPATLNKDKVQLFVEYGISRVSMGVQSMEPELLERLGRIHTASMVCKTYDLLRAGGISNINLDLMFAIPGQTMAMWERTIKTILALGSEHLSCYEVIYEEDTPLYHSLKAGEFEIDEEIAEDMYFMLLDKLAGADFHQYEVANFARHMDEGPVRDYPTHACRHNLNYWRGGSYLGLGPSANGFIDGIRYQNVANTQRYVELICSQPHAMEWEERLTPIARAGELAAFGFRTVRGWNHDEFRAVTGFDLQDQWPREIDRMVAAGWMKNEDGQSWLTPEGLRFADAVAQEFLVLGD